MMTRADDVRVALLARLADPDGAAAIHEAFAAPPPAFESVRCARDYVGRAAYPTEITSDLGVLR